MKTENMKIASVLAVSERLEEVWKSHLLCLVGTAKIKIIKMGGEGIPPERHDNFDEFLLVIEGRMPLVVEEETFWLNAGDYFIVPKGRTHSVPVGSLGTLLLIDV